MVQTKFGRSPVGSTKSYQLWYTEANFRVNININSVPRLPYLNVDINSYPRFPLKDSIPLTARIFSGFEGEALIFGGSLFQGELFFHAKTEGTALST